MVGKCVDSLSVQVAEADAKTQREAAILAGYKDCAYTATIAHRAIENVAKHRTS